MLAAESLCPYCGRENIETRGPKCYFCKMSLPDKYMMYIDSENQIINLCSINCLDLLEESLNEESDGEEQVERNYLSDNICPMCGLEKSNYIPEARSFCKLCGMLINNNSNQYVIRGRSVYLYFCCARCLKLYDLSHQMDLDKRHARN